jgi:hypothetical protein
MTSISQQRNSTSLTTSIHNLILYGLILPTLICLSLFPLSSEAQAAEYDVCVEVLEDFLVPPVIGTDRTCRQDWYYCFFVNPVCCTPVCLLSPDCVILHNIGTVAGYIVHAGETRCFSTSPEQVWDWWLSGTIKVGADTLTGGLYQGLYEIASMHFDRLQAFGTPLPSHVRKLLKDMIAPIYDNGTTGFENHHVDGVKIIPRSFDSTTDGLLNIKGTVNAMTLGDVVIMDDRLVAQLLNTGSNVMTIEDLRRGAAEPAFSEALDVMAHELVHVKQYRALGKQNFLSEYFLLGAAKGYGFDKYEQEAYGFEQKIAAATGGKFCEEESWAINSKTAFYAVPVPALNCTEMRKTSTLLSAAAKGEERQFHVLVPDDAVNLTISIRGAEDADLYVRKTGPPNAVLWDVRPFSGSGNEDVTIPVPVPGIYYVMIRAYDAYSSLTFSVTYQNHDFGGGASLAGLAGTTGNTKLYWVDAVPGMEYTVQTSGGTGDADLYVRSLRPPTDKQWSYRPYLGNNNESVNLPASQSDKRWYVVVKGYGDYANLTLATTRKSCVPQCAGKSCGPDGCGGSCGTCSSQKVCSSGACICVPKCGGKNCGSDGCGGTCGSCSGLCCDGKCVKPPQVCP